MRLFPLTAAAAFVAAAGFVACSHGGAEHLASLNPA